MQLLDTRYIPLYNFTFMPTFCSRHHYQQTIYCCFNLVFPSSMKFFFVPRGIPPRNMYVHGFFGVCTSPCALLRHSRFFSPNLITSASCQCWFNLYLSRVFFLYFFSSTFSHLSDRYCSSRIGNGACVFTFSLFFVFFFNGRLDLALGYIIMDGSYSTRAVVCGEAGM